MLVFNKLMPVAFMVVMAIVGLVGYNAFRSPATASGPIQAVPLQATTVATSAPMANADDSQLFQIQPGQSTARFTLTEVLRGEPKTVVGETDQVAGQIAVDPSSPDDAQVGTILINARTLATDDSQRNRMIQNFILSTNDYEYVSFTPTSVLGLPQTATLGTPYTFQINGQLSLKGVTRDVTFNATVTPVSDDQLQGTATTTIQRNDWGLTIPDVPFVANVSDQVQLDLNFVATATA
jgi:polyisoprenoid-binding protein YceI